MKSLKFRTNALMAAALVAMTPLVNPVTADAAEPKVSHAPAYAAWDVQLLANPATVITLRGTEVPFGDLVTGTVDQAFRGVFCEEPNVCIESPYQASIFFTGVDEQGRVTLDEIVAFSRGDKIILAYSRGALFAELAMQDWASNGTGPDVDETIVVLYGNPANDNGGGSTAGQGFSPIENPYRVLDITTEYDPVSDKPGSGNLLATLNSLLAFGQHLRYRNVDINDPDNLVKVVDGHVYMIVPAKSVPLLGIIGVLLPGLNQAVKKIIDQAYDREGFERLGDRDVMELVAGEPDQQANGSQMMAMATGLKDTSEHVDTEDPRQDDTRQYGARVVMPQESQELQEPSQSSSFITDSNEPESNPEITEEATNKSETEVNETVPKTEEPTRSPVEPKNNEAAEGPTNTTEEVKKEPVGRKRTHQRRSEVSGMGPSNEQSESPRVKRSQRSGHAVSGDDNDRNDRNDRSAVRTTKKPSGSESSGFGHRDRDDRKDDKKPSGSEE